MHEDHGAEGASEARQKHAGMTLWLCRQLPSITDDANEEELDEERYADMDYTREAALLHPWSGGTAFLHPQKQSSPFRSPEQYGSFQATCSF